MNLLAEKYVSIFNNHTTAFEIQRLVPSSVNSKNNFEEAVSITIFPYPFSLYFNIIDAFP